MYAPYQIFIITLAFLVSHFLYIQGINFKFPVDTFLVKQGQSALSIVFNL